MKIQKMVRVWSEPDLIKDFFFKYIKETKKKLGLKMIFYNLFFIFC